MAAVRAGNVLKTLSNYALTRRLMRVSSLSHPCLIPVSSLSHPCLKLGLTGVSPARGSVRTMRPEERSLQVDYPDRGRPARLVVATADEAGKMPAVRR